MKKILHKIKTYKKPFLIAWVWLLILIFFLLYIYLFHNHSDQKIDLLSANIAHNEIWSVWLTQEQMEVLHTTYDRENDVTIAKSLLQQYLAQAKYKEAYELLQTVENKNQLTDIPQNIPWLVWFNYNVSLSKMSDEMSSREKKSPQKDLYTALYLLSKKDYQGFEDMMKNMKLPWNSLYDALSNAKQTYQWLQDAPSYYYTWLLATTLMEAGYVPLTEILANDILETDKNYILSYELLSQIAIKKRNYQIAIELLKKLLTLDPTHIARTSFFLWMSYYHIQDYVNALVYLNQVHDQQYINDAIRYMILSYYHTQQLDRMMEWFRYLLSEQKLHTDDFILLFDIAFYEPYMKYGSGATFDVAKKYALPIIIPFIDSCRKSIQSVAPYVCKYWEAGWYLSQNKPEKALKDLLYTVKTYPHPTVFQALWDYYASIQDEVKAQHYYMKALMSRNDAEIMK